MSAEETKPVEESQLEEISLEQAKEEKKIKKQKKKNKDKSDFVLPSYFTEKPADTIVEQVLRNEALDFLLGRTKKYPVSYSAFITYIGKRRIISRQVILGIRSVVPNMNNWKLFQTGARFFKDKEYGGAIKDPEFIKECLSSENYKVEFRPDSKFTKDQGREEILNRDENRILNLPPRIRYSQLKLGVKVPLLPGEAEKFKEKFKEDPLPKENLYILDYLDEIIKKEKTQK